MSLTIRFQAKRLSTLCSARRLQKFDEFTQKAEEDKEKSEKHRQRLDKDEDIRSKILEAALTFVPEKGWSKEAIESGVEKSELPKVSTGIVTNGPIDLVHFHYERSNLLLDSQMKKEVESSQEKIKAAPFLRKHVENRLRMNSPYLKHWPQAMAIMSLPQNAPKSLHYGLELVDSMWYHAGDKSLDYNWYTKRLTLLAVYKSTELAMMQDTASADFKETWDFLDRRFQDVENLGSGVIKGGAGDVGAVISSLGTTVKALLGLPR